jgi:S-DNA-T family DNA segregation ATPase FtsK/SpoIIIE
MNTAARVTDWRWRHGPVTGPLHAACALTAASTVGALPGVDAAPGLVLAGGAIAAGVTVLRSRHDGTSWTRLSYRLAGITGGTVWLTQAVADGWSGPLVWSLAAGAVTAGLLWRPVRGRDAKVAEQRATREAALEAAAVDAATQEQLYGLAWEWVKRIERVCRIKLLSSEPTRDELAGIVLGIEDWMFPGPDGTPRKTGYTIELLLPTTGETWQTIAGFTDGLASAADLPEGCGVEVGPGASRRRCLIEVSTHDALRDDVALPPVTAPRTINDPVPLGVVRNGAPAVVPLRFESAVLVGAVGSGKSNELQTLMAGLIACEDTLVCVIDYNGGGVALPWLASWVEGEIARSPILWVADNEDEAMLLCNWLLAVIEHRKRAYHAANAARDDDKLAATPQTPQLVLVTDEAGALGRQVTKLIAQISDRGRAAAVRTVTCALRALAEYIPTELLAQAQVRVGMRVNDRKELGYLYDWAGGRGGPSPEDAPYTGYGHYRTGQEPPKVFKGFRTSPAAIRAVAVASAAWRPELDAVTAAMPGAGRVFEDRWERAGHLVAAAGGRPAAAASSGPASSNSAPDRPAEPPARAAESLGGAMDALDAAAERLRDAVNAPRDTAADRAEFDRIMAAEFEVAVPELLLRAVVAFGKDERLHTRDLAAKVGVKVELLGQLLSQLDVRPLPNAFPIDGQKARGYRRADLEAAADRIRSGDLTPPETVARWRPGLPPEWS